MQEISFILILITIGLMYYWLWKRLTCNRDLFKKHGLKYKTPIPVFGNSNYFKLFIGKGFIDIIKEDYQQFFDEAIIAMFDFFTPLFFVRNPDMDPNSNDIFNRILFSMEGEQWRDMRFSLSPLFTGNKLRNMLQLINKVAEQLVDFIKIEYVKNGSTAYNTKDIFSKYTNDVIATCAFGIECDSLKNPKGEIYLIGQKVLAFQKPLKMLQFFLIRAFTSLAKFFGIHFFDVKIKQRFHDLIIHTMDIRRREGIERPDLIQLLMKLRGGQFPPTNETKSRGINGSEIKRTWTDDEFIAQCFLFLFAGFDTSSTVMNFTAYELAVNPDIQYCLINEIDKTAKELNGNSLAYETLQKMKYLGMVISEVLGKWPPAPIAERKCVKSYSYEDENGLKFKIENGNIIWIPIYALHRDPKYFPNPEKFNPKRFSDKNKLKIMADAYLPFGSGPRNCIGMRFALMEIKVVFYYLLLNFKIKPSENTQGTLKLKRSIFFLISEKDIRLHIEPRCTK